MQVYQSQASLINLDINPRYHTLEVVKRIPTFFSYGGWQKFLYNFGMIGPLAFRPCGGFATYGMSCARPCTLLRGPAFLMPLDDALKILWARKM